MVGRLRIRGSLSGLILVAGSSVFSVPAYSASSQTFSVPPGRLSDALVVFAQQAGISIAIDDPPLDTLHTRGLSGRFNLSEALRRLLAGSGYEFSFEQERTVRVWRRPSRATVAPPPRSPLGRSEPEAAIRDQPGRGILVTATKQRIGLKDYPASIATIEPDRADAARAGEEGTSYILSKLPELAATNLGPGRNKIFIRGIADSSFNGTSQATISQYLGDMRLIYSAPDPDLALYDISRVEVLEGPQGTLYGAGTLGGIIRLVPKPPELRDASVDAAFGVRVTQGGDPGGDGAVTINLPLIADRLALRTVAYKSVEGGYIDDALRGLSDVNRNVTTGLRAALRWQPDEAWTIDLNLVGQNLDSRDGQYTLKGEADLTRSSVIAQPFDNDYRLAGLTVSRDWGDMQLVSSTGYAHETINTVFDATTSGSEPRKYEEDVAVSLLSHETRLSGHWGTGGTWLAGIGILADTDRAIRSLGPLGALTTLSNVANKTLDAATFGEFGVPLAPRVQFTIGGRLSYVRETSEFVGQEKVDFEPVSRRTRFLPSVALSWRPGSGWLVYTRYQESYRPGGIEVTGSASSPTVERFVSDRMQTLEVGARFGTEKGARLSGSIAAALAQWRNIQADLVANDGLPYIANIGSGRVRNLAVSMAWRPVDGLSLEAAGFFNASGLTDPAPGFDSISDRDLPNIADQGWRTAAKYVRSLGRAELTLEAAWRYVGQSKLAIVAPFAISQGRYYDVSMGAHLGFGRWGLSLDLDNALNDRGNTFAYGNPFTVTSGLQQTPMRPRSLRIGIDAKF